MLNGGYVMKLINCVPCCFAFLIGIQALGDTLDLGIIMVGGDGTSEMDPWGLSVATGALVAPNVYGGGASSGPAFHKTDGSATSANLPYVDGVFVPKGLTQIDSLGHTFAFPSTGGRQFDALRNAACVYDNDLGSPQMVQLQLSDEPNVPRAGIGMHPNAGVTFDLQDLRQAGYVISTVEGVGGLNFDAIALHVGSVEAWVLLDGVQQYHQQFIGAGAGPYSAPFTIPISGANRFLTLACTDSNGANSSDHAGFADLRLNVSLCIGDFNQDGSINLPDVSILLSNYGCTGACIGDVDFDSHVDLNDIAILLNLYGDLCP